MKDEILSNQHDALQLEKLYREDRNAFTRAFDELYPLIQDQPLAAFWNSRLHFNPTWTDWKNSLTVILILCLIAALVTQLPAVFPIDPESYFPRNAGFMVLPLLTAYFALKRRLSWKMTSRAFVVVLAGLVYINALPGTDQSDVMILVCLHLPIVLWAIWGYAFMSGDMSPSSGRIDFLKFNGDLLVITALLVIAGMIFSGATIGLFSLIGLQIEEFYIDHIALMALPGIPILGTWLLDTHSGIVEKITPVIARIFSPLVMVMLIIYLGALLYTGKDPYSDREFLLIFNVLLVGVLAIIFFSIIGTSLTGRTRGEMITLTILAILTVAVNAIALSAIVFRISEWGFTPNRTAVLGSNVLILIHLMRVIGRLYKVVVHRANVRTVGHIIAGYIPVYIAWALIVILIFPWLFGMK